MDSLSKFNYFFNLEVSSYWFGLFLIA